MVVEPSGPAITKQNNGAKTILDLLPSVLAEKSAINKAA
jgi:hypothetical protein